MYDLNQKLRKLTAGKIAHFYFPVVQYNSFRINDAILLKKKMLCTTLEKLNSISIGVTHFSVVLYG